MRPHLSILAAAAASLALDCPAQPPAVPPAFSQAAKGNCLACHQLPDGAGPATKGDLGPKLDGARMRSLGKARIRELIDDPTRANPNTLMPPFGHHRILEGEEIDRIVEYLHALP